MKDFFEADAELEDATLEDAEDVDSDVDDDAEDDTDAEEDGEIEDDADDDDSKEPPSQKKDLKKATFSKEQQAAVNKIVASRLERQNTSLVRDLSEAAGVEITHEELSPATKLWGLLKANPDLSKDIDVIISKALSEGKAKEPASGQNDAAHQRIALKEAILDLKSEDALFAQNDKKILAWAEKEGYKVRNAKELNLVYKAWKGEKGKAVEAVQKTTAQRKQMTKQEMKKRAAVQTTKSGKTSTGVKDFRKMSDSSILASEGLALFTDD